VKKVAKKIFHKYVELITLIVITIQIIPTINTYHWLIKNSDTLTTNCVSHGRSSQAFTKDSVILGIITIIINTTIHIVSPSNIIGYIIAHFTFHFNSIFSRSVVSSSFKISHNCHVCSQTFINEIVKLSNIFG
jgi:thiamine transporter ThiT